MNSQQLQLLATGLLKTWLFSSQPWVWKSSRDPTLGGGGITVFSCISTEHAKIEWVILIVRPYRWPWPNPERHNQKKKTECGRLVGMGREGKTDGGGEETRDGGTRASRVHHIHV